ncbi:hypothetical protein [Streptococcus pneumoniae]|uniref:hypothetical protein n=1 Tax=Streptococcus pneumoniae TaxID=1313 RepID=UPI000775A90E|nr:hypothetical protein [Streptococcus pneumoniae]
MSSKKHPLGEKRNHPGSKLRQGFWMVFRFGVNNWGSKIENEVFLIFWKKQLTKQTKSCIIKQIFKAGGSGNEKV